LFLHRLASQHLHQTCRTPSPKFAERRRNPGAFHANAAVVARASLVLLARWQSLVRSQASLPQPPLTPGEPPAMGVRGGSSGTAGANRPLAAPRPPTPTALAGSPRRGPTHILKSH